MNIGLRNLKIRYNTGFTLDIDNLFFPSGMITGILGPNGSGKSTLLKLISGIIDSQAGEITAGGKDIKTLSKAEVARCISYVPPQLDNFPMIRVFNLLEAGRYPYSLGFGILDKKDNEKINEALEICDLTEKKDFFLNQLSSGELQRALIAKAIAQDTEIVLMDEPFSNLDPKFTLKIIEIIESIKMNKTIIIAVHDVNIAHYLCDKLVGLKDGKLYFAFDNSSEFDVEKINSLYEVNFRCTDGNVFLDFK
ncbi:ABC transporter ATP-binding protein [Flexistipes sp.]|uniref:ABC transporter ATP-binding protein n=1 Tax=Flexistipes sp. TaxID=3088135 RepID=UPI002E1E1FA8|nr:ABC transporter ATP-binding protein [Flexistipes sp.]